MIERTHTRLKSSKQVEKCRRVPLALVLAILFFTQSCTKISTVPSDTTTNVTTPITTTPVILVGGLPTTAVVNTANLAQWNAYKTNQASAFNWVLVGDSYVEGNYFGGKLRNKLLTDGYADGGPGNCSFGRWDPIQIYSFNQSIDTLALSFRYDTNKWTFYDSKTVGTNGYVTNSAINTVITVTGTVPLSSFTIVYERQDTGSFRYRLNGGAWTTVIAINTTTDIASTVVDVSGSGTNNNILEIEPLSVGMTFCGVIGKKAGNVFIMHKCGISGSTADFFAQNAQWDQSMKLLNPKACIIVFGVNEQQENYTPAQYQKNVQNIINKMRAINPDCDMILMSPPQTKFENDASFLYKQADYAKIMYQLSVDNKAAYINLGLVLGPYSQKSIDDLLLKLDGEHPGSVGAEMIASTIYSALKK